MSGRVLIAGIGNIFLGDDGFGVEVARRLSEQDFPDRVRVADYGISGMHLAFDLLVGYETTILLDAAARGDEPGTVYVIELDPATATASPSQIADAHGMHPDTVLQLVELLGGRPGRTLLVGCEPASLGEGIGLSPAVRRAVDIAVRTVIELVEV
ncbi:MAG: hydrogenase maturation protease [Kutzneria sp.]|nr:hydrogenase maturation protease [Kutzneria sp.]